MSVSFPEAARNWSNFPCASMVVRRNWSKLDMPISDLISSWIVVAVPGISSSPPVSSILASDRLTCENGLFAALRSPVSGSMPRPSPVRDCAQHARYVPFSQAKVTSARHVFRPRVITSLWSDEMDTRAVSPKSASVIASRMDVLPAPVSPDIRNSPSRKSSDMKSISHESAREFTFSKATFSIFMPRLRQLLPQPRRKAQGIPPPPLR